MIRRTRRGQSMIEAMVAITIIISAVSSSMALVQSSITATSKGGAQVVAANLAREGIEVVRAARDTNWLKSQSFQVGLVDGGGIKTTRPLLNLVTGAWTISYAATTLTNANSKVYVTAEGVYVQADSQPTGSSVSPYNRIVTLTHLCRDNSTGVERSVGGLATCLATETLVGLQVGSSVAWKGVSGVQQTLTIDERLYDWR